MLIFCKTQFVLIMYFLLQFQKNTEHSNFSNSVVDVFTQLTQCFEVLQKLECQDPEIWKRYMKRFAKTVVKVVTAYSDLLKADFPNHVKNEPTVRILRISVANSVVQNVKVGNTGFQNGFLCFG